MATFEPSQEAIEPNKGKHLKHIVGLCYIALRPWAPDTQPLWDSKVLEKRFVFSGLTRKDRRFTKSAPANLSWPPLTSKESCTNGRHASSAP
jgi:hypothetical protein